MIPSDKMEVLYNAVENEQNQEYDTINSKDPQKPFNMLLLGRMVEKKGQEEAIKAIKVLKDKGFQAKLTLVGGGHPAYKDKLKALVEDLSVSEEVEIVDFTPHPMQYLANCDLVLMCSSMEAFGRVTIEAMKFGKPVIAGNVGASPEIVTDGFNGQLYEHGNPEDLARQISFFIKNPEKVTELGENAKKWSLENFNYDQHANRLMRILGIEQKVNK
jgi:glycosyltransferase involved in cell wall biosynthesis